MKKMEYIHLEAFNQISVGITFKNYNYQIINSVSEF